MANVIGTGDSSEKDDGVDDAMNEDRNTQDILDSVSDFERLAELLRNQWDECWICRESAKNETLTDRSGHDLANTIEEMRNKITEKKNEHLLRKEIMEVDQYSHEAYRAAYPDHFSPDAENPVYSQKQRSQIKNKLQQSHKINIYISGIKDEKLKMKLRRSELDKKTDEIVKKNREGLQLLKRKKQSKQKGLNEISQEDEAQLKKNLENLGVVKHFFQCAIQGARIDIYKDEELRKLVIDLGKPEDLS